jgi:hypothetical protein
VVLPSGVGTSRVEGPAGGGVMVGEMSLNSNEYGGGGGRVVGGYLEVW